MKAGTSIGAEVDRHAALHGGAGLAQLVLQVGVADVPAEHRARQVGVVAVPVQQVEGRRGLALQVALDDVRPDQVVRPQRGEHLRQLAALEQAALADRRLARLDPLLADQQADLAGVAEVQHRGQQRHAGRRLLAAGREHRERAGQQRAADAEAERVDLVAPADRPRDVDRPQHALLEVVVPGQLVLLGAGVAPGHQEHRVALRRPRARRTSSPAAGRGCSTC